MRLACLCERNRSYIFLPLLGPQKEKKRRANGKRWSHFLGAVEYKRSWQVCTYWNVLLSHTCGEHTHQTWSLASHRRILLLTDSCKNYLAQVLRSRGGRYGEFWIWTNGSREIPAGQAGLQWNKTHQWGVSQVCQQSNSEGLLLLEPTLTGKTELVLRSVRIWRAGLLKEMKQRISSAWDRGTSTSRTLTKIEAAL